MNATTTKYAQNLQKCYRGCLNDARDGFYTDDAAVVYHSCVFICEKETIKALRIEIGLPNK